MSSSFFLTWRLGHGHQQRTWKPIFTTLQVVLEHIGQELVSTSKPRDNELTTSLFDKVRRSHVEMVYRYQNVSALWGVIWHAWNWTRACRCIWWQPRRCWWYQTRFSKNHGENGATYAILGSRASRFILRGTHRQQNRLQMGVVAESKIWCCHLQRC